MDLDKMQENYDIGIGVMNDLMKLDDEQLREKIRSICGSLVPDYGQDILQSGIESKGGTITRKIKNMKPNLISIEFYNWIEISPLGISFHPEHGGAIHLVEFNKHFTM